MENKLGNIKVITGCVNSGKSEKLGKEYVDYDSDEDNKTLFIPSMSSHYFDLSFGDEYIETVEVSPSDPMEIESHILDEDAVFIENSHFFFREAEDFLNLCVSLSKKGIDVFVCGLDQDFLGREFESISLVMVESDEIVKCNTECSVNSCNNNATKSQKLVDGLPADSTDSIIDLGLDSYEARCRRHYDSSS
jgi:thymidine kinase